MADSLSRAQARRIALAAQGFLDRRHAPPTMRTFERTLSRTGVLQIDSVNVLARAHHMPLYSRMGPYDTGLLDRAAERPPRRVVEYWAHVAAYMPVDLWPHMRHRMDRAHAEAWGGPRSIARENPQLVRDVLEDVRRHGPRSARQIDADLTGGQDRIREHWGWNWSEVKKALEFCFYAGEITVARRNGAFERLYDVPERVIPAAHLDAPTPSPDEAHDELIRRAARSHGVASEPCLRDYYRMRPAESKAAVARLLEAGELVPVDVQGWDRAAYLHRDARLPRRVPARALLSPFDPLVWERARTEALFGFHYRIEIYVPEPQRRHGYYVLPFLLDESIVARVDLKADRAGGRLRVLAAYAEDGAPDHAPHELAAELRQLAGWQGLADVTVEPRGDLAESLTAALRETPGD